MSKRSAAALFAALIIMLLALSGCQNTSDGWVDQEAGRYYYINGAAATGWLQIDEQTYYFHDDGIMSTGWQEIDGQDYYFDESGSVTTGWQKINGKYYLFLIHSLEDRWMRTEACYAADSHYLNPDGSAVTGPAQIDGTVYLFDSRGTLSTGWVSVEGRRYYGDENFQPVTGWQEIDGNQYHFTADYIQQTGWIENEGFSYYFYANGAPAQGRTTIGGESCTFAFNGQLVLLVNPWNYLPEDYTVELESIGNNHYVAAYAASDYREMIAACKAAGLDPVVCSSYRTQDYQQRLYNRRIERYMDEGYSREEATEKAGKSVAIPGTSEHQLGLALDIIDNDNWNLDETQAQMPTQKWLMEHSWEYGWILRYPNEKSEITGIIYEPWHYRYVGKAVAAHIHETGLCLEEYLESLSVSVG